MTLPNGFVCAMGIGTVFVSLVFLVAITVLLSKICRILSGDNKTDAPDLAAVSTAPAAPVLKDAEIADRGEFVAAVSAAIAEELGTDVSGIRIISIKSL